MNPNLNALKGVSFSRLIRSGTTANHAIQSSLPGGNAAVSMAPERTARSAFRVEMAMLGSRLFVLLFIGGIGECTACDKDPVNFTLIGFLHCDFQVLK